MRQRTLRLNWQRPPRPKKKSSRKSGGRAGIGMSGNKTAVRAVKEASTTGVRTPSSRRSVACPGCSRQRSGCSGGRRYFAGICRPGGGSARTGAPRSRSWRPPSARTSAKVGAATVKSARIAALAGGQAVTGGKGSFADRKGGGGGGDRRRRDEQRGPPEVRHAAPPRKTGAADPTFAVRLAGGAA